MIMVANTGLFMHISYNDIFLLLVLDGHFRAVVQVLEVGCRDNIAGFQRRAGYLYHLAFLHAPCDAELGHGACVYDEDLVYADERVKGLFRDERNALFLLSQYYAPGKETGLQDAAGVRDLGFYFKRPGLGIERRAYPRESALEGPVPERLDRDEHLLAGPYPRHR